MENYNLGYVRYDDKDMMLFKKLDAIFTNEAFKKGALEYRVPTLLDGTVLEKCGYFNSFPQHLTVPAFVKREDYEEVVANKKILSKNVAMHPVYLSPSACLGLYPMFEGKNVSGKCFTINGNVFRYEEGRFNGDVRLWDFNMREIIFIGEEDYVNSMMEEFKGITQKIADQLGVPMNITIAADHFYPTPENAIKTRFQKKNALKYEMTAVVRENEVALGSFNYHSDHFSKPFNFDQDGKTISACIGYGLQRWVAAVKYAGEDVIKKVMDYEIK